MRATFWGIVSTHKWLLNYLLDPQRWVCAAVLALCHRCPIPLLVAPKRANHTVSLVAKDLELRDSSFFRK